MKKISILTLLMVGISLFYSCKNEVSTKTITNLPADHRILQGKDGTISLKVDNAECYHDISNPSTNTAEWNVVVSKSGRFDIWLSSATKDTTNLQYKSSVMLSFLENRIEARPVCDRIILNSKDVSFPYFRADSFIGSLYIQDTGLFNIQVISEKILPNNSKGDYSATIENSKLLSVMLKPTTH
jgi:hypothetical protein